MLFIILLGKITLVLSVFCLSIEKMGPLSNDNKFRTPLGLTIWLTLPANTGDIANVGIYGNRPLGHVIARHLTRNSSYAGGFFELSYPSLYSRPS